MRPKPLRATFAHLLTLYLHPLAFVLLLTACGGSENPNTSLAERRTVNEPDLYPNEYQVHIIYAIPQVQIDDMLDINGSIAGSVKSMNNFFETASGGKKIRFDMSIDSEYDITFLQLPGLDADYASHGAFARRAIQEDILAAGFDEPKKLYIVYYGGSNSTACGHAPIIGTGDPVAALYLKGSVPGKKPCGDIPFASATEQAGFWEWALAQEVIHTLGFVDSCALHYNSDSPAHVGDDPSDLMYAGPQPWIPTTVDVGQDDYYGANVPLSCNHNLFYSAFLEPKDGDQIPPGFQH